MSEPIFLGVNIDHVATIRQARRTAYPDPVQAALVAEQAGADSITLHLREDRRHVQDEDVYTLKENQLTKMNLEMAATQELLAIAKEVKPHDCCLVPEKREELTTEGGLDVVSHQAELKDFCAELDSAGIRVSLFIDPEIEQIDAAFACNVTVVELHTGNYAEAKDKTSQENELLRLERAAKYAQEADMLVNAGHGLTYQNVALIAAIPEIHELNIGHGIISRAVFVGLADAVREVKKAMLEGRA